MIQLIILPVVLVLAAPAAGALGVQAPRATGHGIIVRDAWVRVSTPLRTSSSAYCRIENTTDAAVALVSITATGAGAAEIHTMADRDGLMSMHPLAKVTVPPHGALALEPGGMHIMLTDIARPLTIGATLAMQFTFDNGRTETVRAVVRPLDAMSIR
jgi:periplasmic copper chaperone A